MYHGEFDWDFLLIFGPLTIGNSNGFLVILGPCTMGNLKGIFGVFSCLIKWELRQNAYEDIIRAYKEFQNIEQ